jgi:hypothetical protein
VVDPKVITCLHCYCSEVTTNLQIPHLVCCKCQNVVGAAFAGPGIYEALLEFRKKHAEKPS